MDRVLKFIGLLTLIIGVGYGISYLKVNYQIFNILLQWFGLLCLIGGTIFIGLKFIWRKKGMVQGATTYFAGDDLVEALDQYTKELPNPSRATSIKLIGQGINRFTRIGFFTFLMALLPSLFLLIQVVLLKQQNNLFTFQNNKVAEQTALLEKQNEKIDNQIQLEESTRRGALIVMMSNIMDKVDEELKEDWNDDKARNLSPQLIGRIAALSQSFRPYRFWQDSMLIEKSLSPERGQLLLALVNSQLDSLTYFNMFKRASFAKANLEKANLKGLNLSRIDLKGANLQGADLRETRLIDSRMSNANLERAVFNNSYLSHTEFQKANLKGAQFYQAHLLATRMQEATLEDAHFRNATINSVDFNQSLKNVDFKEAIIKECEFIFCNFKHADFRNTIFQKNTIYELLLDSVKVNDKRWLETLDNNQLKPKDEIITSHYINENKYNDGYGDYFFIRQKNKEGESAQKRGR